MTDKINPAPRLEPATRLEKLTFGEDVTFDADGRPIERGHGSAHAIANHKPVTWPSGYKHPGPGDKP